MNTEVMFGKATDEWSTPQSFFDVLHREFDFLVDVAAVVANRKCSLYFGPDHEASNYRDGLLAPWSQLLAGTTGAAWMNPPYSQCAAFLRKAENEARRGCTTVALIPSRTDTKYWHEHVWDTARHRTRPGVEIRFVKGRLKFGGSENSAPFPSVVIVFRPQEIP